MHAATLARESARHDNGRFGTQDRTSPELNLDARTELDDLWELRKEAAVEHARAEVAVISARLHPSIAGIRFHVHGGKIDPSRILPADASPVFTDMGFLRDLDTLTSYVQAKNAAVELQPVHDGTESWDWIPDSDARRTDLTEAEQRGEDARSALQSADHDLNTASETYLTSQMPGGAHAVDIAYIGTAAAFTAYDANGESIPADLHSDEWKNYQLLVSRVPGTVRGISDERTSDIIGVYFHLRKR